MDHEFKVNGSIRLQLIPSTGLEDSLFYSLLNQGELEVVQIKNAVVIRKKETPSAEEQDATIST